MRENYNAVFAQLFSASFYTFPSQVSCVTTWDRTDWEKWIRYWFQCSYPFHAPWARNTIICKYGRTKCVKIIMFLHYFTDLTDTEWIWTAVSGWIWHLMSFLPGPSARFSRTHEVPRRNAKFHLPVNHCATHVIRCPNAALKKFTSLKIKIFSLNKIIFSNVWNFYKSTTMFPRNKL